MKKVQVKQFMTYTIKTINAGAIIGLCSYIYQSCENKIVGAFLFGIGLVIICACGLPLFTGRVGSETNCGKLFFILICNILGVLLMRMLFLTPCTLVYGIGCGMLMQIGVVSYKKKMPWLTVMCIAAFLLSDFKHSIAMIFTLEDGWINILNWLAAIVGNILGAKWMYCGGVKE